MFTDLLTLVTKSMDLFILIFSRMMGMFFIAPMFSRNNIPATVKVGLSMIMSYIILPFIIS
ncbi:flagellar biosynthetic protein FliR, partial [Peptoanaerobacter stomatis]